MDSLKRVATTASGLVIDGFKGLSAHHGTQLAAGMAYYALFSIFPIVLVVAAGAGFFLDDPAAREDAIDFLLRELPIDAADSRDDLGSLIDGVTGNAGTLGLVGVLSLLVSSSALISSARTSLNIVFDTEEERGALRGKGLDVLLIFGLGLLFALSFAITIITGLDVNLGAGIGEAIETALNATGLVLPVVISAAVFAILYTFLPTTRPALRDVWPGVLFAAIVYELLKRGFSFYLDNFASYGAVYGSLGAVIAFMFFAYVASVVFLVGAEIAARWPQVRDAEPGPPSEPDPRSFAEKARGAIAGLFERRSSD